MKMSDELIEVLTDAVRRELMQHFYTGTLTDSDVFKYTPVYTGNAFVDKMNTADIQNAEMFLDIIKEN